MSFEGKYQLCKSENFDEYLKARGAGFLVRKLAASSTPVIEITKTSDEWWTVKFIIPFRTTEITFQMGKEFHESTIDGRECESKITIEGENRWVQTQTCNGETQTILRDFTDNKLTVTLQTPGVICIRVFQKL